LAILHPDSYFTLVDSVQKKIRCVEEFAKELGLKNVIAVSDRLEILGRRNEYREQFDIVVTRALAPLPVLLELGLPLVKINGKLIAMKGPSYTSEISDADNAIKKLNTGLPEIEKYILPDEMGTHYLLIFDKKSSTSDQYPRRIGVPNKTPL
jgi:16S rRNA (guanine527-N7)-methyltransferase